MLVMLMMDVIVGSGSQWHQKLPWTPQPPGRARAALRWGTGCPRERLAQLATLVAVAYQTHNILRHRRGGPLRARQLLVQVLREMRAQAAAGER